MSFPSTEVRLIATFKQGLKKAVGEIDGYSWDNVDSITEQKLLLMAIRDQGIEDEVTIQWYADGDMLPKLDDGIDNLDKIAIYDEDGEYPSVNQVRDYYTATESDSATLPTATSVTDVIDEETFGWLREYYEQREGPFQGLYLCNIDIHLHLYQCANACDPDSGVEEFPDEIVRQLKKRTTDMKQELLRFQIFRGLETYVSEFADVAETVLVECSERGIEEMGPEERAEYQRLLQHLDTFYYQGLWKQITRLIAVHTIDGPEDYFYRAADWGRVEETKEKFVDVFEQFQETAADYDVEVGMDEDWLPEVWILRESISKEEFLDWERDQALPREAVSPVSNEDPTRDLVS
jgi:hypothetical protein